MGIHSDIKILKDNRILYETILPFSKSFEISWGASEKIFGTEITFFALKPDKLISETFGLDKEVILIYSNYKEIQARTFQASDQIFNKKELLGRVDPLFYILLSPAINIYKLSHQQSTENTQNRIIVPISTQDLKNSIKDKYFILNQIKKYLFSRDLFDFQQPITSDLYFFGRSKLVQELRDSLIRGENLGLFGLRKTGKTSVLLKIKRQIETHNSHVFEYIDLQDPTMYGMRWWELLNFVRTSIGGDAVKQVDSSNASRLFKDTVDRKTKKGIKITIAFDEIEHICPNTTRIKHWDQDFLEFWKSLRAIQNMNRNLTFIVAGVNATPLETSTFEGHDNPLFSMIKTRYIGPLESNEVSEMLQSLGKHIGISFEENLLASIYSNYGGHPLLSRLVASKLYQNFTESPRPFNIGLSEYNLSKDTLDRSLIPYCQHILGVLKEWYPNEYTALETLAVGETAEFEEIALEIPEFILHLESYGLIEKSSHLVRIPILAEYVKTGVKKKKIIQVSQDNSEIFEEWSEVSKLRNQLEPRLRKFIKRILKSQLGETKWIEPIIKILPKDRQKQCLGIAADEILNNRLLFTDLLKIITTRWNDYFKALEATSPDKRVTKAQFEVLLDYINTHREDAHAKEISEGVIPTLTIACNAINSLVDRYLSD